MLRHPAQHQYNLLTYTWARSTGQLLSHNAKEMLQITDSRNSNGDCPTVTKGCCVQCQLGLHESCTTFLLKWGFMGIVHNPLWSGDCTGILCNPYWKEFPCGLLHKVPRDFVKPLCKEASWGSTLMGMGINVVKNVCARNYIKCPELYRKIRFTKPHPSWDGGGGREGSIYQKQTNR